MFMAFPSLEWMLLVHVCLVANDLNHPDAKLAKAMPAARTLSATIFPMPKYLFDSPALGVTMTRRKLQCFTSQPEPEAPPGFWFHGSFASSRPMPHQSVTRSEEHTS